MGENPQAAENIRMLKKPASGWATEIKVRAERRTGELLAGMEKHTGTPGPGRSKKTPSSSDDRLLPPTLKTLGISRDQSSQWQQLAKIPK
jgi:hypothetical protein